MAYKVIALLHNHQALFHSSCVSLELLSSKKVVLHSNIMLCGQKKTTLELCSTQNFRYGLGFLFVCSVELLNVTLLLLYFFVVDYSRANMYEH